MQMMTYDKITYNKNVDDGLELKNVALAHSEDFLCGELINGFGADAINQDISKQSVYYITDLHLDEKIDDRYSDNSTDDGIKAYIDEVAKNIAEEFLETDGIRRRILLIGGDVSHKYEITAMFYSTLSKYILPDKIIAILGNHELWDSKIIKSNSRVDTTIERYRKMFNKLKIRFLQNSILILKRMGEAVFISESEIKKLSVKKLRDECADGTLLLLGGIGFAGRNDDLNADSGMYRETLISRDEEKGLSSDFEALHRKLRNAVSDAPVIILTHMPMRDWSRDPYESNWCYVSGHTHKNKYCEDDGARVFEDNQIGRKDKPIRLKYFDFGNKPDILRYYEDGKYTLNRKTYIDFYRNLGYEIQINGSDKVVMIKKNGFYCFFCKLDGSYRILEGGRPHRVVNQDLNYYYNNLTEYGTNIIETLKPYTEYLTAVSDFVKSIKGSGKIHGCIVDIDYDNHIFVNPFDSKLTAYFAFDIINKIVYPTLEDLLKERNPRLYMEYIKLIENCSDTKLLEMAHTVNLELPLTDDEKNVPVQYLDTDIYGISRRISRLQYTEKCKIIRIWDDNFVPSIKVFPPLDENIASDDICHKSPGDPYEIPYFRLVVEEFVETINWLERSRSTDKFVGSESHHKLKISEREMIIKTHNKFYKATNDLLSEQLFEKALSEATLQVKQRKITDNDRFDDIPIVEINLNDDKCSYFNLNETEPMTELQVEQVYNSIRYHSSRAVKPHLNRAICGETDYGLLVDFFAVTLSKKKCFLSVDQKVFRKTIVNQIKRFAQYFSNRNNALKWDPSKITQNEIHELVSMVLCRTENIKNTGYSPFEPTWIIQFSAFFVKKALDNMFKKGTIDGGSFVDIDILNFYALVKLRNKKPDHYFEYGCEIRYLIEETTKVVIELYEP